MKRVEHFQVTFTRYAESHVGPMQQQLIDKDLSAGPGIALAHIVLLREAEWC
jgi:hypothetical protein